MPGRIRLDFSNRFDDSSERRWSEVLVYWEKNEILVEKISIRKCAQAYRWRADAGPINCGNPKFLQAQMSVGNTLEEGRQDPRTTVFG